MPNSSQIQIHQILSYSFYKALNRFKVTRHMLLLLAYFILRQASGKTGLRTNAVSTGPIRLRKCAVWSGPSLSAYRITVEHIRLRSLAGPAGPLLFTYIPKSPFLMTRTIYKWMPSTTGMAWNQSTRLRWPRHYVFRSELKWILYADSEYTECTRLQIHTG